MIMKKKAIITAILLLAATVPAIIFGNWGKELKSASAEYEKRPKIIIDAGHGGFDGGAVASDGTVEKDINLNIASILAEMLKFSGYEVIMTRSADIGTDSTESTVISERKKSDLKNRLELMKNNPEAIFVSIHLNKFTTSAASGAQVFYSKNLEISSVLGQSVQETIVSLLQPENKRAIKQGTSITYLLHNATVPAIIVECGFLSNIAELKLLKSEEYQSKLAFAIWGGIINYCENE